MPVNERPQFVTLGMFIIDEFEFRDEDGKPTGKVAKSQIGGGGTYAAIGARTWLPPNKIGMVVDRGHDFPGDIREKLLEYGEAMWMFREQFHRPTTRALNLYYGEHRDFRYLTDRVHISPLDLNGTKLSRPHSLHFICSPARAKQILTEVQEIIDWYPVIIYEPIPDSCTPESLPALKEVLHSLNVLSPNAEEALKLLSLPFQLTRSNIEQAGRMFLECGVGMDGQGAVIIRSGQLGAFVITRRRCGAWVDAYWTKSEADTQHVVDVTGAGNSFLGGLAAGLFQTEGDVYEATLYGTISASFAIEQEGLPLMTSNPQNSNWPMWNGDSPRKRLADLRTRLGKWNGNMGTDDA